jgi:hypothetical protein
MLALLGACRNWMITVIREDALTGIGADPFAPDDLARLHLAAGASTKRSQPLSDRSLWAASATKPGCWRTLVVMSRPPYLPHR